MNYEDRITKEYVEGAISDGIANAIVCGAYTGDGTASQFIELGFTPRAVLVMSRWGQVYEHGYFYHGGLCVTDAPVCDLLGNLVCQVVEGGFQVYAKTTDYGGTDFRVSANLQNQLYRYLAVR